jgi:ABC-type polar amino acid transport system ATPase subunit
MSESDTHGLRVKRQVLGVASLAKSYGGAQALRDVSFDLRDGEILGIIGPSGGGKSTLLKCLNFLEWPTFGTIRYQGSVYAHADGKTVRFVADSDEGRELTEEDLCLFRRRVGFVFQAFNLWEDRTVLGNLALAPVSVLGEERGLVEDRAVSLCKQFGLAAQIRARVQDLSGGERQRVAIIRALMMRPELMLLDEVTSALDPVLTVEVMQAIQELRARGLTMIVVTHHLEFATTLCDRIMFLAGGVSVQTDTPARLRHAPATSEIERFLDVLQHAR